MAKKTVDETLRYTIIINGDKGQKELYELEKATKALRNSNKELLHEKDKLKRAGKEETAEYKKLTAEIKVNNAAIKANEIRMSALRNEIGITSLSMEQLAKKANELKLALRQMSPGSADFKRYQNELNQVNNRLRELRMGANQTKFSLQKLGDEFNRYQSLAFAVIASITGVVVSFQKLIDFQGKLSDAQADVAKTTDMSTEAVDDLTRSLGLFKTRSARIELLGLAEEAGRLGIRGKKNLLEFVGVADQIKVALGDDLQGDANENLRIIGKLTEQYKIGADVGATFGQGMTMVGSAINTVSASGSSQAGYLVDYLSRLVGISRQANISAQDQIGFAAVLDESGQRIETSATATSQAIIGMYKDTDTYAGIAGMAVTDFRKLLETDANEAFLRFLQGLNGNNAGLEQLAQKFDGLGIDGSRAISVLAALASQTDKIREKQSLANDSLYEATSLQEEFNKKNENFAAILNRINKRLGQLIIDGRFVQWLQNAVKWFAVLIGAIDDAGSSANRWRNVLSFTVRLLAAVVAGLVAYKTWTAVAALWTSRFKVQLALTNIELKIQALRTALADAAMHLYAATTALLTGNLKAAKFAMRGLQAAIMTNPFGLLLGLITAVVVAIQLYNRELTQAEISQKTLNEAQKEGIINTRSQKEEVIQLANAAADQNKTLSEREAAIKKLNALSPGFLGNLTAETIGHLEAAEAISKYIKNLQQKAEYQALLEKRDELAKARLEKELEGPIITTWDKIQAFPFASAAESAQKRFEADLKTIDFQLDEITKRQTKLAQIGAAGGDYKSKVSLIFDYKSNTPQKPDFTAESPEEKAAREKKEKQQKEDAQKAIDRAKALHDKISDLEREAELERMQANEREIAQVQDKYKKLREEAKGHKTEIARLNNMEAEEMRLLSLKQQAEADEERIKKEEETQKEIQRLREQYGLVTVQDRLDAELKQLQDALDKKLITEEEYLIALKNLKEKYNNEIDKGKGTEPVDEEKALNSAREEAVSIIGRMSGAVNNLMNLEMQRNEVVKQAGETEVQFSKRKEEEEGKRMETSKKYARLNMLLTMSQIIADTAAAIMKAPAQLGVYALPFQIAYGVLGATQLGIAAAENKKIQGYEEGLYPVLDHKNRRFNAAVQHNAPTGKLTQPTILAGEKPEIIIDPLTTRHLEMNYPQVIDAIYSSAARVRGFESGHYPDRPSSSGLDAQIMSQVATALAINASAIAKLEQKLDNGIAAYYDDAQVRTIRTRLEVNNQVKSARTL